MLCENHSSSKNAIESARWEWERIIFLIFLNFVLKLFLNFYFLNFLLLHNSKIILKFWHNEKNFSLSRSRSLIQLEARNSVRDDESKILDEFHNKLSKWKWKLSLRQLKTDSPKKICSTEKNMFVFTKKKSFTSDNVTSIYQKVFAEKKKV